MARYGQFCGVARALDLVGDRWTLLLVRELLVRPRRFVELRGGLPGIASNLLVARLDSLQAAGVVERRLADRGQVYALTAWGEELRGVIRELVRWSVRTMAAGPAPDDEFRPEWLVVALDALLGDVRLEREVRLGLDVDGWRGTLVAGPDGVRVVAGPAEGEAGAGGVGAAGAAGAGEAGAGGAGAGAVEPDAVLTAPGPMLLGAAAGVVPLDALLAAGSLIGDRAAASAVLAGPRSV